MKIAVIYSLPTRRARQGSFVATDEDTADTAGQIEKALLAKGAEVSLFAIDEDSIDHILRVKADVIVNIIEWDGHDLPLTDRAMQILESRKTPFTGSERTAVLLANDKQTMKKRLEEARLPTPVWQVFKTGRESILANLRYPIIVKLVLEHCSIGLSPFALVTNEKDLRKQVTLRLRKFHQPVLVEEYIDGREFQVTLIEKLNGPTILPPAEIIFDRAGLPTFLTYESRWVEDHPEYDASTVDVARLSANQLEHLGKLCRKAFRAFGFRDYSRIDIRMRGDKFYILEANANPGLGDDEDYGMTVSYKAAGMSFSDFMWQIVQSAINK